MSAQSGGQHREKKYFPVRLRLHYTWIFVFIVIIAVVATQFTEALAFTQRILIGIVASFIFLLMVILRQLGIDFIARRRNVLFRRVTLYIFGGVPGISREYTSPLLEVLLGSAGLMFNILITALLYGIYVTLVIGGNTLYGGLLSWLAFAFSLFTVIHFIPAYPLDNGRNLRALLWRLTHDYYKATRISVWVGEGISFGIVVAGIAVVFINQEWLFGIALILIGWIIYVATAQINRNAVMGHTLRDLPVSGIMSKHYPHAAPHMSVATIIREYSVVSGQYYFMVVGDNHLLGSVGLKDIKSVPRKLRDATVVAEIMIPSRNILTSYPSQSAADAYEQMLEMDFEQMPVIESGNVVGAVFFDKLQHLAKIKNELRM